jgi:microcystin degradation protein MlrC
MVPPRIAVAGFQHESNSFAPFNTELGEFEKADGWPPLTTGAALLELFRPLNIPLGGFIDSDDIEPVPLLWASAEPAGPVTDHAFDVISHLICTGIAEAGPLDGLYLDLHGAMVVQSHDDGEGELLRRVRAVVGPDLPIIASLDMHANITRAMLALSDAMAVYRTYPHIDMAETGARCRDLMLARIARGRPFAKAFRKLPFMIPMPAQITAKEPFHSLYGSLPGRSALALAGLDFAAGFPLADIEECGPAVVAYGHDQETAKVAADALFADVVAVEEEFASNLMAVDDAVALAIRDGGPGRPVILADVQDNPGGGASSDTTGLISALVAAGAKGVVVGLLCDPAMVLAAREAGVGGQIGGPLGGRHGYDEVPLTGPFGVEALSDGQVVGTGVMFRDTTMSLGPMALLRVLDQSADVRIAVCSIRFQCLDQALFRALGVEPADCAILGIKSTVHFRADFEPIASSILAVESPGATICRNSAIPYRKLRSGVRLDIGTAG